MHLSDSLTLFAIGLTLGASAGFIIAYFLIRYVIGMPDELP